MDNKTVKFQMLLEPSFANAIDDWSFSNRIRTRAEAIRRLIRAGLEISKVSDDAGKLMAAE